ncbi:MAG TPA: hypothetical protein VIT91_17710 [Chthoniobacterales bacterium]
MTREILKTSLVLPALFLLATSAHAGETETPPANVAPPITEEKPKVVSGTLTLYGSTHFFSYGADVWGAGNNWDDYLFEPTLELSLDLGKGFSFIVGTWWDVNDNDESTIGNRIQEIDVWAGIGYTTGKWSFSLLYQAWMYLDETEEIIDFKVAYDTFLHPSILIHGRTNSGAASGDEGVVVVLGLSEDFAVGPVTFNFPLKVGFMTEDFQAGDAGFGYVTLAAEASVPVPFLPGDWTFTAGVTGFYTNPDVVPNNPDDTFVSGSTGLTLAF